MDVKQKIQQYLDYKGIKTNRFEKEVGLSNGYWRKTNSVSANAVAEILRVYSDLSAEWILRGEGEMLRTVPGTKIDDITKQLDEALNETRMSDSIIRKMIKEEVEKEVKKQLKKEA